MDQLAALALAQQATRSIVWVTVSVGLGMTSRSMSASAVADVRAALAAVTLAECRELASNALAGLRAV